MVLWTTTSFVCTVKRSVVLLERNDKSAMNHPLVPLSALIVLLPGRERMTQPGATLPDAAVY